MKPYSKIVHFLFVALSLACLAPLAFSDEGDAAYWKSVYEGDHVVDISIALTSAEWDAMEPTRGEDGDSEFNYVKANISIDGKSYKDAGLRFKGNSSYRFSRGSYKRPMKLDMNRFVKGQKLHGRTKVNLSNAFLDSAYMKEKLAYELYEAAGIPAPGVGWATVTLTIDGVVENESLGAYVLVEQVDKKYLERTFGKETKGSLLMKPEISGNWEYPGADPELYEPFEIKVGEDNKGQIRRFGDLLKLIHSGSDEAFEEEIGERMDLKQLAGYLAATSVLASIDSYVGMPHNYYLLMDKADGKLRVLPWDVNESFGTFSMGSSPGGLVDWDIDRPWVAELKLLERLFATESFPKLYKERLSQLVNDIFTEEKVFARINTFEKTISPKLNEEGKADLRMGIDGDAEGYNAAVERSVLAIKPFVSRRIESVKAQLAGTREGTRIEGRRRGGRPPRGGPGRGGPGGRPEGRPTRPR